MSAISVDITCRPFYGKLFHNIRCRAECAHVCPSVQSHEHESTIHRRRGTSLRCTPLHRPPLDRCGLLAGTSPRPKADSGVRARPRQANEARGRRGMMRRWLPIVSTKSAVAACNVMTELCSATNNPALVEEH